MKSWDQEEIGRHLQDGMEQAAPDEGAQLWARICTAVQEEEAGSPFESAGYSRSEKQREYWYLKGTEKQAQGFHFRSFYGIASAAAAVFVLVIALSFFRQVKIVPAEDPWAIVCLDVNPGVTLELDERERVVRALPGNEDVRLILDEMALENVNVQVAVNALVGSMVRHGYLTQAKQFILLTVDGKDTEAAEVLRQNLSSRIDRSLEKLTGRSAVFDQLAVPDSEVKDLAGKYGITTGKAYLLKKLTMLNPQLKVADLAGMTMEELYRNLKEEGIDLSDYADYTGDDLEDDEDAAEEDDDILSEDETADDEETDESETEDL